MPRHGKVLGEHEVGRERGISRKAMDERAQQRGAAGSVRRTRWISRGKLRTQRVYYVCVLPCML